MQLFPRDGHRFARLQIFDPDLRLFNTSSCLRGHTQVVNLA